MAINKKNNITLGLGVLEIGDYDSDGVTFLGYRDIGAIKGTLKIEHQTEVRPFDSGRPLRTIVQHKIREAVMVTFSFGEITLGNFKSLLGSGVTSSNTTSQFLDSTFTAPVGGLQSVPNTSVSGTNEQFEYGGAPEHDLIGLRFTHPKQNKKRIIFEGYLASPHGNLTLPFNEQDHSVPEVEFTLLADTNRPDGKQFYRMIQEL